MMGGLPKTTNEVVQITLEWMKTALAEAQTNLALAQKRMATAATVEAHVLVLSGISVELTAEDLQTWTKAYKEDKSHVAAYCRILRAVCTHACIRFL